MPETKKIITFNIGNVRAAFREADGSYGSPISIGKSSALSLEVETTETPIYGDGEYVKSFAHSSVGSGTLTLNDISDEFEIAAGRKLRTSSGLLDVMQRTMPEFALYFEVKEGNDDGSEITAKNVCYHCGSTKAPALKTSQTDNGGVKPSSFELTLKLWSEPLKYSDGTIYHDAEGREVRLWKQTVTPGETGFETFGDTIAVPTMAKA